MYLVRHGQSEWNLQFGRTRIDPGLPDPVLTVVGHRQAAAAAERLATMDVVAVVTSPYRRCLQTAFVIASRIGAVIGVDPLVRERCAFSCDQGSPPAELVRTWPELDVADLPRTWWGSVIESQDGIDARASLFRRKAASWPNHARTVVVSHWGFIRALTGREVGNGVLIDYEPGSGVVRPDADGQPPAA